VQQNLADTSDVTFAALGLPGELTSVLAAQGISSPFPIQAATLPDSLAGRDVLGKGQTGSGKTLAFLLPVLARLAAAPSQRRPGRPRALILAPTRELASQIDRAAAPLAAALKLTTATVYGGVGARPQITALRAGVDVLVACPGRLSDHVESGHARLDAVEITVLDEADHMADLGFLPVVKKLLDLVPQKGQRLLFSATLDGGVDVLVRRYLRDPVTHSVDLPQSDAPAAAHHVLHVSAGDRLPVLVDLTAAPGRTLVFTRTKYGARKLAKQLTIAGVPATELHGDLAQNARSRNLAAFADGHVSTLVATDVAARGIHVDDIALVVHADPPGEHKAYVHRSGRTARAGAEGKVITLMTDEQVSDVRDLTRKAGIKPKITRLGPGDAFLAELAPGERTFRTMPPVAASQSSPARTSGRTSGGSGRTSGGSGRTSGGSGRGSGRPGRDGHPSSGQPSRQGARRSGGRSRQGW
jgi:superfamily II DNA/RNA helicase